MAIDTPDWMATTQIAAPVFLGSVSQAIGQTFATGIVNAIPLQTGWVVVFDNQQINFAGATVQVADDYSLVLYFSVGSAPSLLPPLNMSVASVLAAGLTISASNLPVNGGGFARPVAYVFAAMGAGIQAVYNTPQQPLYVKEVPDSLPIGYTNDLKVARVASSIAVSSTLTVITAIAGNTITVYGWTMTLRAGVTATIGLYQSDMEDTTAAQQVTEFDMNWATAVGNANEPANMWIPPGIRLPVGAGLKIVTAANPGTMGHNGAVFYTQGTPV